ncbi:multicopper oxidase family protein [Amycolatopsis panacis]|uniref:Multicopper oxidase CueO n=1 Tax=Amycolatopsis panacis TaxID=2340917 RepID=A0A419I7W1_9PSEU|nr:multicopper oxidase domain-containing protein [Amycolatopsis panacis]RJQ87893.1 multicopper oxidase family protein [Amycolatopsis panacis]
MTGVSRRVFLGAGLAAGIGLGVGIPFALGARGSTSTGAVLPSLLPPVPAFAVPLPIPPVLSPVRRDAHADYYEITQAPAQVCLLPGLRTGIWGYNGIFPGPTLVSRRGRPAVVTHTNRLPVPTVVHLHGGRTPHTDDGYPVDFLYPDGPMPGMPGMGMPGGTRMVRRAYTYPMDQRAATLWYHDHRMDFTGPSVWRGLAGFHLVRDEEEDALGLPSGPRELPLMITDRSFDADGSLRYPSREPALREPGVTDAYMAGVLGDVMLVNGAPWPVATVEGAQYRLRILNACNARRLDLRLDPGAPLTQIGTDGGLLAAPLQHNHFELAPAQRLDVVVDFSAYRPGTIVTLVNDFGEGRMGEILRFAVGERAPDRFRLPGRLGTVEPLGPPSVTRTMHFASAGTDGWRINGAPFGVDTVAASPTFGSTEVWRLVSDFHHPVHLHLNPFQVLSRGLAGPGPFDAGWKDTIDLRPAEDAAIAVRFDGYRGKYVFHCHNLEHEDMAMMGNFVVT